VRLVLRHEAEADILEAFRWYESKRVGLGEDFVDEVDAGFVRVLEAPGSFPVVYRGLRRIVLKRFPYVVYFRHETEVAQVFGVLHGRRDRNVLRRRAPR
jgi:plasmid stabilization system protein ParE